MFGGPGCGGPLLRAVEDALERAVAAVGGGKEEVGVEGDAIMRGMFGENDAAAAAQGVVCAASRTSMGADAFFAARAMLGDAVHLTPRTEGIGM